MDLEEFLYSDIDVTSLQPMMYHNFQPSYNKIRYNFVDILLRYTVMRRRDRAFIFVVADVKGRCYLRCVARVTRD